MSQRKQDIREPLFGPFPNNPGWQPSEDQFRRLLNDFEQTHDDIRVEFIKDVQQGPNIRSGNAITGVRKPSVPDGVLHVCPRRVEDGRGPGTPFTGSKMDVWGKDRTCSYCGSLHPDDFMAKAASGEIELGPTDKNYKVYIKTVLSEEGRAAQIERLKQHEVYLTHIKLGDEDGARQWLESYPISGTHIGKFYFQHLSQEQRQQFVDLLNAKALKIGCPGHFYRLPFFCMPSRPV